MRRPRNVLGLDLSLRSSGAVVLRTGWCPGPAMFDVPVMSTGYELKAPGPLQTVVRLASIVSDLARFADAHGVTHAYVEDLAYGLAGQQGARLAGLADVVRVGLYERLGLVVVPVNQNTVRKFFLGKLPPRDRAGATHAKLRELGCPWDRSDYGDAFLVASYGRTELGLTGLTVAV